VQTIFLVWLPGLGGLLAGAGVFAWLSVKVMSMIHVIRRDKHNDQLLISTAETLKEVCGEIEMNDGGLSPDLADRLRAKVYEVEAVTHKQL
jgi:hypothetical protein